MKRQPAVLRTLRAAEYPFLGVQTKTNTDKSIINARLHTKAAQREEHERDEHSEERSAERECRHFKNIASFKDTLPFACNGSN